MTGSSPLLRLVLAVSLDGRLAPPQGGAAQIGGAGDRRVLEEALAWADGALLGAETLRRHGSTCLIHAADLLAHRRSQGRPPQPVALVASRRCRIASGLPFFHQPLERWLLLGQAAGQEAAVGSRLQFRPTAAADQEPCGGLAAEGPAIAAGRSCLEGMDEAAPAGFARVIPLAGWQPALEQLAAAGLERLVVLGGAALAASLLAENRIDELQLTLCPQLLGGEYLWLGPGAVVPLEARAGWRLLEQRCLEGEELLLRYGRDPDLS